MLRAHVRACRAEQRLERKLAGGKAAGGQQRQRTLQSQEVLQKWMQCVQCNQWRKVRGLFSMPVLNALSTAALLSCCNP